MQAQASQQAAEPRKTGRPKDEAAKTADRQSPAPAPGHALLEVLTAPRHRSPLVLAGFAREGPPPKWRRPQHLRRPQPAAVQRQDRHQPTDSWRLQAPGRFSSPASWCHRPGRVGFASPASRPGRSDPCRSIEVVLKRACTCCGGLAGRASAHEPVQTRRCFRCTRRRRSPGVHAPGTTTSARPRRSGWRGRTPAAGQPIRSRRGYQERRPRSTAG